MTYAKRTIGLLGNAGVGKDTVGKMVVEITGGESVALADPLKLFARDVFRFSDQQLWGPSEYRNAPDPRFVGFEREDTKSQVLAAFEREAWAWLNEVCPPGVSLLAAQLALTQWVMGVLRLPSVTPRIALQTLGTEFGRKIKDDMWLSYGLRRAARAPGVAVITDVRFINEAEGIRKEGGEVWSIDRRVDGSAVAAAGVANHASEAEQKSDAIRQHVTHYIDNNGTLDELRATVQGLLNDLRVQAAGEAV